MWTRVQSAARRAVLWQEGMGVHMEARVDVPRRALAESEGASDARQPWRPIMPEGNPIARLLVCDDAPQANWLAEGLALCWVYAGPHHEKPVPAYPGYGDATPWTRFSDL